MSIAKADPRAPRPDAAGLTQKLAQRLGRRGLRRFARNRRAAVTVEFAMIMPLLITLMLASVEAPAFLDARAGVADAAGAIGDLTSQSVAINEDAASVIFLAANRMIDPDADQVGGLTARLTSALVCECENAPGRFCFTVIWSHGFEEGALAAGFNQGEELTDVSESLALAEDETIIIADVSYLYRPRLTGALKVTEVTFSERMFFRPRSSREVTHLGAFQTMTPMICEELETGDDPLNGGAGSEGGEGHETNEDDEGDDGDDA